MAKRKEEASFVQKHLISKGSKTAVVMDTDRVEHRVKLSELTVGKETKLPKADVEIERALLVRQQVDRVFDVLGPLFEGGSN